MLKKILLTFIFVLSAGYASSQTTPALDALNAAAAPGGAPVEVRAPAPKPPVYPVLKWQSAPGLTLDGARTYVLDATTCVVRLGFLQGDYNQYWHVFDARLILSLHSIVRITTDNLVEINMPNTKAIDGMTLIGHQYAAGGKVIYVEKSPQADQFTVKACLGGTPPVCREIDTFSLSDIYTSWAAVAETYPVQVLDKKFYMMPQYYSNRAGGLTYGYAITYHRPMGYYVSQLYNIDFAELFVKGQNGLPVYKPAAYSLVHGLTFVFNGDPSAPSWTARPMLQSEVEAAYNDSLGNRHAVSALPAAEVLK